MAVTNNQYPQISKQARDQLGGLTLMFLLGMGVNLIGLPSETTGAASALSNVLMGVHALIGVGLIAGAIVTVARAKHSDVVKLAWLGLIAIILTFACGVITAITGSNAWSYAMAVGFIANMWIYGVLFVKTRGNN